MNWTDLFTSFDGRISRQPFWIGVLILVAIEIAAHYALGERPSTIASLLLAYPEFAVFAKRGHDRNVPTWAIALFIACGAVLNLMLLFGFVGPTERPTTAFMVIGIPMLIAFVILLVDFGFRRGTVGPNRYGPDPLASRSSE
jgi:uncharacterized membrane protein YhaH (DUF805 family)